MLPSKSAANPGVRMRNPLLQAGLALVTNASIGVKCVSAIVTLSYCLSYSESAILSLSVTPGYFWPPHFWFWTAFTHCFLEIHWWEIVVDIVTVVLVSFSKIKVLLFWKVTFVFVPCVVNVIVKICLEGQSKLLRNFF